MRASMTHRRPLTASDFARLGARVSNTALVNELLRKAELAKRDATELAGAEWDDADTKALAKFAKEIPTDQGGRAAKVGERKASRSTELAAVRKGKLALQSGLATARNLIRRRGTQPPAGETEGETARVVNTLIEQADAIDGTVGYDTVKLGQSLGSLVALLKSPDLPAGKAQKARDARVAALEAAAAGLPTVTSAKKQLQDATPLDTAGVHEKKGRAYDLLRSLADVGRKVWRDLGSLERAKEYSLADLVDQVGHRTAAKAVSDASGGGNAGTSGKGGKKG